MVRAGCENLLMKRFLKPQKISASASAHSQGLAHGRVFKRLLIAGQIGADHSGEAPADFESQVALAFDNLLAVIEAAQLTIGDLVRIMAYAAVPDSLAAYHRVYQRKLGPATPVSTYVEIAGLGDPRWLILIEGEAIQESDS
jgi:2-iminobutanoate/2-iminopropanoate deaminase